MSVISLPLQRWSLQSFNPDWGQSKAVQRDFSLMSLCRALFPELFGGVHICRSQELKAHWGSLLAPYPSWKTLTSIL